MPQKPTKPHKKKGRASTIALLVIFLAGLSVLLYPSVSNYYNQFHASRAVANYDQKLGKMSKQDFAKYMKAAKNYNAVLARHALAFKNGNPVDSAYKSVLNVTGDGMMGYISIKKLGVLLPIYHGTSMDVLATGAGHLEGSSLPVGGASTHAVITGHRGLPSAKLFTDLDRLQPGDTFTITTLNETLTYEVDKISIVLPADVSKIDITPGKDYVTLVTCTPYGINTHRMLVRGTRIPNELEAAVPADAMQIDPTIVAPIVAAPMLLVLLILLLTSAYRRRKIPTMEAVRRELEAPPAEDAPPAEEASPTEDAPPAEDVPTAEEAPDEPEKTVQSTKSRAQAGSAAGSAKVPFRHGTLGGRILHAVSPGHQENSKKSDRFQQPQSAEEASPQQKPKQQRGRRLK